MLLSLMIYLFALVTKLKKTTKIPIKNPKILINKTKKTIPKT